MFMKSAKQMILPLVTVLAVVMSPSFAAADSSLSQNWVSFTEEQPPAEEHRLPYYLRNGIQSLGADSKVYIHHLRELGNDEALVVLKYKGMLLLGGTQLFYTDVNGDYSVLSIVKTKGGELLAHKEFSHPGDFHVAGLVVDNHQFPYQHSIILQNQLQPDDETYSYNIMQRADVSFSPGPVQLSTLMSGRCTVTNFVNEPTSGISFMVLRHAGKIFWNDGSTLAAGSEDGDNASIMAFLPNSLNPVVLPVAYRDKGAAEIIDLMVRPTYLAYAGRLKDKVSSDETYRPYRVVVGRFDLVSGQHLSREYSSVNPRESVEFKYFSVDQSGMITAYVQKGGADLGIHLKGATGDGGAVYEMTRNSATIRISELAMKEIPDMPGYLRRMNAYLNNDIISLLTSDAVNSEEFIAFLDSQPQSLLAGGGMEDGGEEADNDNNKGTGGEPGEQKKCGFSEAGTRECKVGHTGINCDEVTDCPSEQEKRCGFHGLTGWRECKEGNTGDLCNFFTDCPQESNSPKRCKINSDTYAFECAWEFDGGNLGPCNVNADCEPGPRKGCELSNNPNLLDCVVNGDGMDCVDASSCNRTLPPTGRACSYLSLLNPACIASSDPGQLECTSSLDCYIREGIDNAMVPEDSIFCGIFDGVTVTETVFNPFGNETYTLGYTFGRGSGSSGLVPNGGFMFFAESENSSITNLINPEVRQIGLQCRYTF